MGLRKDVQMSSETTSCKKRIYSCLVIVKKIQWHQSKVKYVPVSWEFELVNRQNMKETTKCTYGAKIIFENRKSSRIPVKFAALASTSRKYP